MNYFNYIVSGTLLMRVKAATKQEADEKAEAYLESDSPVRDWELYHEGAGEDVFEVADIDVP